MCHALTLELENFFFTKSHPPALRLAAVTTQQPDHHDQCEDSSWPMKAWVTIVMVKEALSPQLLNSSEKNYIISIKIHRWC